MEYLCKNCGHKLRPNEEDGYVKGYICSYCFTVGYPIKEKLEGYNV